MPKVCPFLLAPQLNPDFPIPAGITCFEDKCAWWITNHDTHGCAVPILTAIVHDLALVRYPSLAGKKRYHLVSVPGTRKEVK